MPDRDMPRGLEGDWDGTICGRGSPPPKTPMPVRPIRINFTDAEIEDRLKRWDWTFFHPSR